MKRSAASIARAGDIQRRDSTAPPPIEEESLLTSEDEDSPAESSESLLLGGDEDGEEEEDDPQYNNVCEYCRCKLSEDVSIYVYSKRDDVNADMAACSFCADFHRDKIREEFWISDSDPGEMNFSPHYDAPELEGMIQSMENLTEHWSFQHGRSSSRPSKHWAECVRDLVAALHSTADDDIRGDVAVCIGQQNEEMRLAFVQANACAALVKALTSQNCEDALHKYDFSLRSLARLPMGRERASAALVDALKIAESSVTIIANPELPVGFSMSGLVFTIAKFAQNDDNRCTLIQAGAFPLLVTAAGSANDTELINLFYDAITTLSRDEINRVPFVRNIFQHVLSLKCAPPSAFTKTSAQQIQLNRMLQDLSRHFEEALALARGRQLDIPVSHGFLGRLLVALNLHLQIHSDLLDLHEDCEDQESATNAAIGSCIRFLGMLLSKNDAHESNFNEGFSSVLSELHGDAYDPWAPSSFLNSVSRRVIAIKLPASAWNVTVDCKAQQELDDSFSARSSRYARRNRMFGVDGSSALIAPLQEHAAAAAAAAAARSCHFNDALCAMCQCSLFEIKSDGSIVVIARQLKCFELTHEQAASAVCKTFIVAVRYPHVLHADCAERFFIQHSGSQCPICRYSFGDKEQFAVAAALDHQVLESGLVQWKCKVHHRLKAIQALITPMSISLEDGRVRDETVNVPKAASVYYALVHSLCDRSRDVGDGKHKISTEACSVLRRLTTHDECWAAMIQDTGVLELLVAALRHNPFRAALVMVVFCSRVDGRQALLRAGVCEALVHLLVSWNEFASRQEPGYSDARFSQARYVVIDVIYSLCKHASASSSAPRALSDGRARLIKCGIASALVDAHSLVKNTKDGNLLARIAHCLHIVKPRFMGTPQQQYPLGYQP